MDNSIHFDTGSAIWLGNAMRQGAFKTWLKKYPAKTKSGKLDDSTINAHLTRLKQIESEGRVDLDAEFKADGLTRITVSFNDGNERGRCINASGSALSTIRSQLGKYHDFCKEHPPI